MLINLIKQHYYNIKKFFLLALKDLDLILFEIMQTIINFNLFSTMNFFLIYFLLNHFFLIFFLIKFYLTLLKKILLTIVFFIIH